MFQTSSQQPSATRVPATDVVVTEECSTPSDPAANNVSDTINGCSIPRSQTQTGTNIDVSFVSTVHYFAIRYPVLWHNYLQK